MKINIRSNPIRFLIGQDFEMMLLNRSGKSAPLECPANEEFGADGTGFHKIREIRTVPTECPLETVNHIYHVFKRKVKKHPKVLEYNWQAGSFKLHPLGGHLQSNLSEKTIPHKTANRIISNYCGSISLLLEDRDEAISRRSSGDYGGIDDFRVQFHGGFESRVFSSWATSPAIAAAHLCLFKTVLYEAVNNKSFSPVERFENSDFTNANQNKIRNHFDNIWSEIVNMKLYKEYKQYLDILPFLVKHKLSWFPSNSDGVPVDVKAAWGICSNIPEQPKPEVAISLPKINNNPIFANL